MSTSCTSRGPATTISAMLSFGPCRKISSFPFRVDSKRIACPSRVQISGRLPRSSRVKRRGAFILPPSGPSSPKYTSDQSRVFTTDRRFPSAVMASFVGAYSLHCVIRLGLSPGSPVLGSTRTSHRLYFSRLYFKRVCRDSGPVATENTKRQSGDQVSAKESFPALSIVFELVKLASDTRFLAAPPLAGRTSMADFQGPWAVFHLLAYAIQRPSGDQDGRNTLWSCPASTSFQGVSPSIRPTHTSCPVLPDSSFVKAIIRPSGEMAGSVPCRYSKCGSASPSIVITQMSSPSELATEASNFPPPGNQHSS